MKIIEKCPCEECLVFSQCKMRLSEHKRGVTGVAITERCEELGRFMHCYRNFTKRVNRVRKVYGLKSLRWAYGREGITQLLKHLQREAEEDER